MISMNVVIALHLLFNQEKLLTLKIIHIVKKS
ncbi:unnamed protein product [Brugia pahangi]|uniref:Uncharacterized protein n=1 Tax=Brugia pahangi TaxID=6280 RepID=A0A0N4T4Y5_BRUPA|nr:unnamed protein product [Brugia pahangi]